MKYKEEPIYDIPALRRKLLKNVERMKKAESFSEIEAAFNHVYNTAVDIKKYYMLRLSVKRGDL